MSEAASGERGLVERLEREALAVLRDMRQVLVTIRDSVPMDARYLAMSADVMRRHNSLLAAIHADHAERERRALAARTEPPQGGEGDGL